MQAQTRTLKNIFRTKVVPQRVMFVGDGLNDAVALAAADVSAAMGHGSQATLASADFVILSSSLDSLITLPPQQEGAQPPVAQPHLGVHLQLCLHAHCCRCPVPGQRHQAQPGLERRAHGSQLCQRRVIESGAALGPLGTCNVAGAGVSLGST
jgi:hypothetical protein